MDERRERKYNSRDNQRSYQKQTEFIPRKKIWKGETIAKDVDFKDVKFISRFITERGKVLPRKITGLNAQQQRKITNAIKRARQMGLLPFISYGYN